MDDAFCGSGDSNEGISDTSIPISAVALKMIKAAVLSWVIRAASMGYLTMLEHVKHPE